MNTTIEKPISDYSFRDYLAKQHYALSFGNIGEQVMALRKSDKFIFSGNEWVINPYHGFAVVSMGQQQFQQQENHTPSERNHWFPRSET
ncbi:MAG: hypothetical protein HC905_27120 [Bacteroidales bacterium]|nr:hypothetical protein [Bacteroidales bacterium]